MGNANAADDARTYREGYPHKADDPDQKRNLQFYSNERPSKPEGDYVDNIHIKWWGKYSLLESHHGYIQWLFPIREDGMNGHAQQLQLHEAKAISSDPTKKARIIKSYELMLDFYGMKLVDQTTGKVDRNPDNWKSRYQNLNSSFHNYLRITRILKCLGEMELEHYKRPFCEHILKEVYEQNNLRNCLQSCTRYWIPVIRDDKDRVACEELADQFEGKEHPERKKSKTTPQRNVDSDSDSEGDVKENEKTENEDKNSNNNNNSKIQQVDNNKEQMESRAGQPDTTNNSENNPTVSQEIKPDQSKEEEGKEDNGQSPQ